MQGVEDLPEIWGVGVPSTFPTAVYDNICGAIEGIAPRNEALLEAGRGAWLAVGYRYLAVVGWDTEWRSLLAQQGLRPTPAVRLKQESAVFAFHMAAVAVVDSFCFAVYCLAANAQPKMEAAFRAKPHRIDPPAVLEALKKFYPEEALTEALVSLLSSPDWERLTRLRNVLAHRSLPVRTFDDLSMLSAKWSLGSYGIETTAVDEGITTIPRAWLEDGLAAVSYTHLTLPTKRIV